MKRGWDSEIQDSKQQRRRSDYTTLYNSFGLSGLRSPPWYLPTSLTSFTELLVSPKQPCSHLRVFALTVAPARNILFPICTQLPLLCHLGFSLNVTTSEDFPNHPTPFSFLLCTPSQPSELSIPLTCFILFIALNAIRNYLFTCVPQLEHKLQEGVWSWPWSRRV